jgi:hypothetical protein
LWLRLFSPKATQKPLLRENEDYCFSEIIIAEEPIHAVKILTGPYKNVVIYYGHVKLIPENGTHRLAFQYTIWDSSSFTKKELVESAEFIMRVGDTLASIIADEKNVGEYGSPRANDTEESDLS